MSESSINEEKMTFLANDERIFFRATSTCTIIPSEVTATERPMSCHFSIDLPLRHISDTMLTERDRTALFCLVHFQTNPHDYTIGMVYQLVWYSRSLYVKSKDT